MEVPRNIWGTVDEVDEGSNLFAPPPAVRIMTDDAACFICSGEPLSMGNNPLEKLSKETGPAPGPKSVVDSSPTASGNQPARAGSFGRALGIAVLAALAVGGVWYATRRGDSPQQSAAAASIKALAEIPEAKFTDITGPSGIRFTHNN